MVLSCVGDASWYPAAGKMRAFLVFVLSGLDMLSIKPMKMLSDVV